MKLKTNSLCVLLVVFSLLIVISPVSSAEVTIVDDGGNTVTLPDTASRIVATNTHCAELLVALGAGDNIVGISRYIVNDSVLMSHMPKGVENIGDWQTPDIEGIIDLDPDLIISYSSAKPKNLDQITALGIPVAYLDCYKSATLADDARALGVLTGTEEKAGEYADWFTDNVNMVSERLLPVSSLPTVYLEGYPEYSAQGKGSGGDQLLFAAKGKNIASSLSGQWPKVSAEWVIDQNPDYLMKLMASTSKKTLDEIVSDMKEREGFETMSAVKDGNVYALNGEAILNPKYPVGLLYTAKILHPETFADINPDEVLEEYDSRFVSGYAGIPVIAPV